MRMDRTPESPKPSMLGATLAELTVNPVHLMDTAQMNHVRKALGLFVADAIEKGWCVKVRHERWNKAVVQAWDPDREVTTSGD